MAQVRKLWTFDSDFDGWTETGTATNFADGSPDNNCTNLRFLNFGAGGSASSELTIVDTWSNIFGIPANSTINTILQTDALGDTEYYVKQSKDVVRTNVTTSGPFEIWDSGHSTKYHQLLVGLTGDVVTWTRRLLPSDITVDSAIDNSDDTIELFIRLDVSASAGGVNAPYTRFDSYGITLDYTPPPLSGPILSSGIIPHSV